MSWGLDVLGLLVDGARVALADGPLRLSSTLCIGNAHAEVRPATYFVIHRAWFFDTGDQERTPPVVVFGEPQTLKYAPEGGIGPREIGGLPLDWHRDGRCDLFAGLWHLRDVSEGDRVTFEQQPELAARPAASGAITQ